MSNSMTSTQQIMQRRWPLLPEALLVFHCDKRRRLCISGLLISRLQLSGCCQAVWRSGGEGPGALVPKLGWKLQQELVTLQLRSCLCPWEATWQLQQQLKDFIRKLHFLKPCSASVLCFAAERLPRTFSGSTCLSRCKRSAHLPRAGNLLPLAENAAPLGLGPFGALPRVATVQPQQHKRGKQNFYIVFIF